MKSHLHFKIDFLFLFAVFFDEFIVLFKIFADGKRFAYVESIHPATVVFPLPVAPATHTLTPYRISCERKSSIGSVAVL